MAQATSGKVLREARERKGYDLNTVARRLRIRPDILRAIEAGDFNAMPPRGYTRNMVNAYAKLLGLNPTEIVNLYLDEAYAQQVERARGTGPSSGFNMQRETRRSRSQLGVGENSRAETRAVHPVGAGERESRQFTRMLYDDGTPYSRDDYGVTRQRAARPGKSDRDFSSHHSGYDTTQTNYGDDTTPRRGGRSIYAGQTPMHYSASRLPGFLQSRAVLIALAAAIVIIIAIIFFVVLGGRNDKPAEDVSQLPVSGITDTTESSGASKPAAEVAPTSARVVYSVKSGEECYAEIYNDGQMAPENLKGPVEKTVDVTGVWTIATWDADKISVTVDGQKVELKPDQQYGGMYSYTVDFPTILKQWNEAHKTGSGAAASTTSSTDSSSTSAQATTGTATSSSTQNTQDDGTNYVDPEPVDTTGTTETGEEQYVEDQTYEEPVYDESQQYTEDTTYYEEPVYDEQSYQ